MRYCKYSDFNVSLRKLILIFLCTIFIVIASNRFWMSTSDTEAYLEFFEQFDDFWLGVLRFEPAFSLLTYSIKALYDSSYFYLFVIASIGVGLKFIAIRLYAPYAFLSLLLYFSKYFLLQDMIQIRAGVASAIFLLSIKHIQNRNFWLYTLYIFLASMFHFSAAFCIILYFICNKRLNLNVLIIVGIALLTVVKGFELNAYLIQYASDYFDKIQIYMESKNQGIEPEVNIMSVEFFMNCSLFAVFYFLRTKLIFRYPYYDIWLKSFGLSLFMSIAFSDFPVFSLRISELFGVVSILLFPLIIDSFKERLNGYAVYFLLIFALTYNFYFKQGMIF